MNLQLITERYLPPDAAAAIHGNVVAYEIAVDRVADVVERLYHGHQLPLKIMTALDERAEVGTFRIMYVFGLPRENAFLVPFIRIKDEYPSLTPLIHEVSLYERKIKSFFGLNPSGHPDPRSLILHENWPDDVYPLCKDFPWNTRPETAHGKFEFQELRGEGIYEIPVGPVHAGIIEPGHFRFSVAGEEILLLEPWLGYSHRGCEKLFETVPLPDKLKLAERISGDSSFGHALAFCLALETLSGTAVSNRDNYLLVILAELERLVNHLGDIGAIMTDTGYNFGGANGARLRESVIQINERVTRSRFLRGALRIGGVDADLTKEGVLRLGKDLDDLRNDFAELMAVAERSSSLLNRLKSTGTLDRQIARDHGVIGVAGRAVGFQMDARVDFPYAAYDKITFEIANEQAGDVEARFNVRVREVFSSIEILRQALRDLPDDRADRITEPVKFRKNSLAIGIVEGWRGDIVYVVASDADGNISRVDVRDPSFLNWSVLGHAGRDNVVPDFPLINKSFNLSYSGNDL